jgi:hypothetical protein
LQIDVSITGKDSSSEVGVEVGSRVSTAAAVAGSVDASVGGSEVRVGVGGSSMAGSDGGGNVAAFKHAPKNMANKNESVNTLIWINMRFFLLCDIRI